MISIGEDILKKWNTAIEDCHADSKWFDDAIRIRKLGEFVRPEIKIFLQSFSSGKITIDEFRETFDKKTRKDWDYFGFKGLSGAMLLNMFVKNIPDKQLLTDQMRLLISEPQSHAEGREKIERFTQFIEKMIEVHNLKRKNIQPSRIPYLITGLWHFQSPKNWPLFYVSTRMILEWDGIYTPSQNAIKDYFQFREIYLSLISKLEISTEEMDDVSEWRYDREQKIQGKKNAPLLPISPPTIPSTTDTDSEEIGHTHVQWMLAKIGKKMGYSIWIASNDRNKRYLDETLGSLSIDKLPQLGLEDDAQKTIQLIDVIWLKDIRSIVAAFEVEKTTSIFSGLLRLSDLVIETPNISFPLFIVAPENRQNEIKKQLERKTFQRLELPERCGYFSDRALIKDYDSIMKYGNNISAIHELATRIHSEMRGH